MHLLKRNFILIGIICLHLSLMLIFKFTAWPEMLAYPYLISRGYRFYEDMIHPYMPLLPYVIFGVGKITGFTLITLRVITYLTLLISDILIWNIARRWFSQKGAILTVAGYVWLSLVFDGNGLWFDLFLVPFLIFAWYLFLSYRSSRRAKTLYLTSFILGIAVLIKQTAIVYEVLVLFFAIRNKRLKSVFFAGLIFLLPFMMVLVLFPAVSVWKWGIVFPFTAISQMPGYIQYPSMKQILYLLFIFLPVLGWIRVKDPRVLHLGLWFIASFLFLFPRFDYFHLQPVLPFFVLGTALVISKLKMKTSFVLLGSVYLLITGGWGLRMLSRNFNQPPRFFSRSTVVLGDYLDRILPNDTPIFFYNTPANLMISAQLLPSKPWVDNFPWYMELPGVQEQIVDSLEKNHVRYVVFTKFAKGSEYELGVFKPKLIDQYIYDHFKPNSIVTDQIQVWQRFP